VVRPNGDDRLGGAFDKGGGIPNLPKYHMFHAPFGNPVRAGCQPGGGIRIGNNDIVHSKKGGGSDHGAQIMIIPHGIEDQAGLTFFGPKVQVFLADEFHRGFFDHGNEPLVAGTLTDPFQLIIIADLIGPFPVGQIFAYPGKQLKPVFPEKQPVDAFRVKFPQSRHGIKAADRQLFCKFVTHCYKIPQTKKIS
jgi:hypothetical protein